MGSWITWRRWLWISTSIPAIIIILWPGYRFVNLLALVWVAVIGLLDVREHRKQHEGQIASTIKSNQKQWIKVMNHHRHDWMNDLQILFGYVKLGKQQYVAEYVERIKDKMLAESSISKLNDPNLISYLFSYRSIPSSFQLEIGFEYESDRESIHIDDEHIGEKIIDIISAYRLYASKNTTEDQVLKITFIQKKEEIHIQFLYSGTLINEALWMNKIEEQLVGHRSVQWIGALQPDRLLIQMTKV